MSDPVFKLALPGEDVTSASSEQLIISSSLPSPKINVLANPAHAGIVNIQWLTTGINLPQNTIKTFHSFDHGYNHIPATYATFKFDNGTTKVAGYLPFAVGALGSIDIIADTKSVYINYLSVNIGGIATPPFNIQVRFYVFAERGHQ